LGDPVKFLAALCLKQAVPAPTRSEAATVAGISDAVSLARTAAESLYRVHVANAPKAPDSVLNDPRRQEALRRTRSVATVDAERFVAADALAEVSQLAAATASQRLRRSRVEELIQARVAARKAARRLVRKGEA
jgi:hypothetical protein